MLTAFRHAEMSPGRTLLPTRFWPRPEKPTRTQLVIARDLKKPYSPPTSVRQDHLVWEERICPKPISLNLPLGGGDAGNLPPHSRDRWLGSRCSRRPGSHSRLVRALV